MGKGMIRFFNRWVALACGLLLSGAAWAEIGVGDCVIFREGGDGRLLKTPTYWVKGSVLSLTREHLRADTCPVIAKPLSAYSREDRVRLARSAPCVFPGTEARDVAVTRVRVSVDSWETPWSHAHGTAGLLFRGAFLEQTLVKGGVVEIFADWLESCELGR